MEHCFGDTCTQYGLPVCIQYGTYIHTRVRPIVLLGFTQAPQINTPLQNGLNQIKATPPPPSPPTFPEPNSLLTLPPPPPSHPPLSFSPPSIPSLTQAHTHIHIREGKRTRCRFQALSRRPFWSRCAFRGDPGRHSSARREPSPRLPPPSILKKRKKV